MSGESHKEEAKCYALLIGLKFDLICLRLLEKKGNWYVGSLSFMAYRPL